VGKRKGGKTRNQIKEGNKETYGGMG